MHTIQDDNQIQVDMPIPKENSEAILKNIQVNNQKENYDNNLNNTQNRSSAKEEVSDNENYKIDKDSMKKVFLKKEKNTKNLTPINSNNEEDSSNKEETEITISKKIGSEIDDDSYEKFIDKNKLQYKVNILTEKTIMIYTKRMYLVKGLIHIKSKIKQQMKEFCDISNSQKELLNYVCIIQENSLNISILKSVIKKINPPTIFNIRKKFIDLIIYWVIKKNEEKFKIDKNYIPENNYLNLISKILEKKIKNSEIEQKINFVSDNLFSYLKFYKRKCSNSANIGKEEYKYYDMDDPMEHGKDDCYRAFNEYEYENGKELKDIKIKTINENTSEKNSEIDIEFVFRFLFYKFEYKTVYKYFEDKLKLVNKEKIRIYESSINSMTKAFNKILATLEKSTNIPEFGLDDYEKEEKTIIENSLKKFKFQITSFKELIKSLEKTEKNMTEYIKKIDMINEELDSLVNKECFLTDKYYIDLDVKEVGSNFLLYLQYKYMKLKSLYEIIEVVCKKYLVFLQKNRIHIETMVKKVKEETEIIYKKIIDENMVQSGKDIFQHWKTMKRKRYDYKNFISELKKALKEISSIKIDDDAIDDVINSCWLVKTKLDEYLVD